RELAGLGRYESAARLRDHTAVAIETLWRGQRLHALATVAELVAAQPDGAGGWHLAVARHGQLAAAGNAARWELRAPGSCMPAPAGPRPWARQAASVRGPRPRGQHGWPPRSGPTRPQ